MARRRATSSAYSVPRPPQLEGTADSSQYSRGAVLKLRLSNFLTFDAVVIEPKPQLNVIVGPNGTGKSSIVCALCLGLAGSTTLLGRAKDVKDFVKHGCTTGFVEITLYDDRANRHPVIRRTLSAENNSSKWTINRSAVYEKDVKKLVESLGIQLDNRCMFLPQDKVVEFARMNKQELLLETEKTVGPKKLYQHHEELKKLKSSLYKSSDVMKTKKRELEDLERKNRLLERDVERYKNKQNVLKDIKHLTNKKHWLQYQEARESYDEKKKERKQANLELKKAKECYQPIKDRLSIEEEEVEKCKRVERLANQEVHQCRNKLREKKAVLTDLGDMLDQPKKELEMAKEQESRRRLKMETFRKEIEGFKRALEDMESTESVNSKIANLNAAIKTIQEEINNLADKQRELMAEREQWDEAVRKSEEELRKINNIRTQRLQKLEQRKEYATVEVMAWLQSNQQLFKQPIFEPVCMSLNIRDPRYAKQAEAFFGGKDFFSFIAQNDEDRELFLREVRDKMHKKVNIVRAPSHSLKDYNPTIPFDTLRRYGFAEMLLNVVEAPEPVLCYFCQFQGLHNVPIAGNLRPEEVQRITSNLAKLQSFFTTNMRYSMKRSKYRDVTSTRSSELFQPSFLVASVNTNKKKELQKAIHDARTSLSKFDEDYRQLEVQDRTHRREDARLRDEKKKLRTILDSRRSTVSNIKSREKKLEQEQAKERDFDLRAEEEKCAHAVNEYHRQRVALLGQLRDHVEECIVCTDKVVQANLTVSTAEARSNFLKSRFCHAKSIHDDALQKMEAVAASEAVSKQRASSLLENARKETGVYKPTPEMLSSFAPFPEKLDDIEELLHDFRAQADVFSANTDTQVFEEFKAREQDIEKLKADLLEMEATLKDADSRIKEVKKQWLEPLLLLIDKVNVRFQSYFSSHMQMKCAGMVSLEPHPKDNPDFSDFEKYGVQIKVKFRDQEELQELNAQRQSGGERSVSTMLYLMALQGNTSCPFRVVDEINQGMDPVNERHVFNLVVKSASQGSQYFLLTPKVLQNLEYSDAVTVHIVNNGQEIMNCDTWNLAKFLS